MTVKATFRPNRASVAAAGRSEGVYRELERRAAKAERLTLALYEAHRKTGEYGRGFHTERVRIRGQAAVRLVNNSGHALILELGSRPHVIEPKDKQALAWPGGRHPVKRVNHPGAPALHLMRNGLRAAGR
ncbi:hypothetical protein ACQP2Y_21550 [Actinoplanes sp. CA-051413]|uniref:hypothetical protein n=1 Tax=Actinoplanes sp. CA-051413 TaxID=3239899 RepID=UPI003D97FE0A